MLDEKLQFPYAACELFKGERVLVLAPHPDDEIFGCGGALALHAIRGDQIMIAIITDGGGNGSSIEIRKQESQEAARVIGAPPPRFWDLPDRSLAESHELPKLIQNAINEFRADLIYLPSPCEIHPDHRATALAGIDAVLSIESDPGVAFYEIGIPLHPTHLLDITKVGTIKNAAARCFASQNNLQDYYAQIGGLNKFRTYTLPAEVQLAEGYVHTRASLLRDFCWPFPANAGAKMAHQKITHGRKSGPQSITNRDNMPNKMQYADALALKEQELLAIKNSHSWKVTRPLRRLASLLRGIFPRKTRSN